MVVNSASSTASVADERKRTMTMERAKAAHLSRQLQLRLQYARLKVEHGWQKQNLNEVENLYFRHSHTKPRQSPKDQTLMTLSVPSATQQSPKIYNVPDFQTSSSSSTTEDTSETVEGVEAFLQPSPVHTSPTPQVLASNSPTPSIPENAPVYSLEPSPMAAESTAAIPTVVQPPHQPTEFSTTPQLTVTHKQGAPESVPTYPITSYYGALFPTQPPTSYGTRYAQIPKAAPLVVSAQRKAPSASPQLPSTAQSQLLSSSSPALSLIPVTDPFKYGNAATGSLTYDSFWSSHLASRSRPSFSSDSNKPAIANPLPRRATDIAQTLSSYLSTGTTPGGPVQTGSQHPEVSSTV